LEDEKTDCYVEENDAVTSLENVIQDRIKSDIEELPSRITKYEVEVDDKKNKDKKIVFIFNTILLISIFGLFIMICMIR